MKVGHEITIAEPEREFMQVLYTNDEGQERHTT